MTAVTPEIVRRSITISTRKIDTKARTAELSFSSEAPVARTFGSEILDHSPAAVRLGRLNNGGALLLNHETDQQVGVILRASIGADRKGRALVKFGKSQLAEEIFQDVVDGIRRLVSVGYQIHRQENQGKSGGVETVRVTDWEPYEISIVSIPADSSVGVGRGLEPSNSEKMNYSNTGYAEETNRIENLRTIGTRAASVGINLDVERAISEGISPSVMQERLNNALVARNTPYAPPAPGISGGYSRSEQRDIGRFSLARAVASLANGRGLEGIERELETEARNQARNTGLSPEGNLVVPVAMLAQRDMTATGGSYGSQGGATIATQLQPHIPLFHPRSVLRELGATFLTGLTGNVVFPRLATGSAAAHLTENGASPESSPTFDQVSLTPHRLGTFVEVSKQLLIQSNENVESMLRNDLLTSLQLGMQNGVLNGTGADNQPLGLFASTDVSVLAAGTNGAAVDWDMVLELEAAIATANADGGNLGYLTNPQVRKALKGTLKATGFPAFCWEKGDLLNDYRAQVTTQVSSTGTKGTATGKCSGMAFGNWADLVVAIWGAIDIQVNPYSRDTEGLVRITAAGFYDTALRRPQSFAVVKDLLTA